MQLSTETRIALFLFALLVAVVLSFHPSLRCGRNRIHDPE